MTHEKKKENFKQLITNQFFCLKERKKGRDKKRGCLFMCMPYQLCLVAHLRRGPVPARLSIDLLLCSTPPLFLFFFPSLQKTSRHRVYKDNLCAAVCCSVLQSNTMRVAVCCSVLQSDTPCVAMCCTVSQCDMTLKCVAVCCGVTRHTRDSACCSVLQCVAVCCSVLQCVAITCVAVCRSHV